MKTPEERIEILERQVAGLNMVVDVISLMIPPEEFQRARALLYRVQAAELAATEYQAEGAFLRGRLDRGTGEGRLSSSAHSLQSAQPESAGN